MLLDKLSLMKKRKNMCLKTQVQFKKKCNFNFFIKIINLFS